MLKISYRFTWQAVGSLLIQPHGVGGKRYIAHLAVNDSVPDEVNGFSLAVRGV